MSSPSIFPVELYNAIIDVSDFDMLGTYRLVCQAWLRSSQYRYFRQVRIDDSNIQAFVDSLSSPMCRIAPLIHKLEILFQFDPSNLGEYPDAGRLNGLAKLPIFVSLTSLRLRAMKWAHISVDIQAVFRPFREVVELEIDDVYFDDVSQLVEMFCAFPSLQSLTLQGGVGYRDTDVMTPSLRRANVLTRLKTIKITNSWCPEILTLISLCLPKPALETLHLSTLFLPSMPFFGEFVTPSAPFLKEVKFLTTNFGHDAEAILDVYSRHIPLRLLTELRSIEFSVYEFRHDGTTAQCLLALLSQVTSPIEEVIMKSAAKSWTDSDEAVWAAISALLCGQQFDHLRRLCFQFNVYPINDEEARHCATSLICAHLPACEARGILEFSSTA